MAILNLSSPWIEHYRKIDTMFQLDPDTRVVYDETKEGPTVTLYVADIYKADALDELIKKEIKFGKVTMKVIVVPPNNENRYERAYAAGTAENEQLLDAFRNNSAINYIQFLKDVGMLNITYVVCRNMVVQYFNDSLNDAHGLCSTLFENIARDVFIAKPGLFYCTDIPGSKYEMKTKEEEIENND